MLRGGWKVANKITKSQYEEIEDAYMYCNLDEFHETLAEHTGIVAYSYTAYSYFDANGNYVGDSNEFDLDTILENAYMEVVDDGN